MRTSEACAVRIVRLLLDNFTVIMLIELRMPPPALWTIDVYETEVGIKLAWVFMQGLQGRDQAEAIALVKLLEERGNTLRRPHSGALGDGLFELRGKQVRIFYMFLPNRVVVLLDGETKKRDDIPVKTLERVRSCQKEVARRGRAGRRQEKTR